ncbi:DUF6641 family protein [Parahaliea mediterranea]|uniref:DUF6641 family protein n=1 Tax=Parahaliea mediterranea TaxID=651086 RepID=UPI000E2ECCDE|nr:DUF6641 family protein [Parahaliea mediterranea]
MRKTSVLSKLNFAPAIPMGSIDPVQARRYKLIDRLSEQRQIACAHIAGETCEFYRDRWVNDDETGGKKKVRVPKRVKSWYLQLDGKYYLQVRYGNRALELTKGKPMVEIAELNMIPEVIDTISEAVSAGELDDLLMAVKGPSKQ